MTTTNVQLWHSALVLLGLVGAVLARAASALKAHRDAARAEPPAREEPAPTRRLAA